MQVKWLSFLFLILLAGFVESSSGQQAPSFDGSQNRSLPPIVQARDFRFSQRQIQAPQQAAYQQPAYQQPAYQQPAYQRNLYQQAANPTATPTYQEARERSVIQAAYPQAQSPNQYGAVEQQGTVDAQAMLLEQRWQQFRHEQTARLAARQIPPAQPVSQSNQPQDRPYVAPTYQPAPKNPYAQQSRTRRQPPAHPAGMTQAPQEEDPFGKIEDPFGDSSAGDLPLPRAQDPGGQIVWEQDPSDNQIPQQPDPFEGVQEPDDPFDDQTVPKPEQPPMREPTLPIQDSVPTPPVEPTLPDGILEIPQIQSEMRQAPVPPMPEPQLPQLQPETYPPEAVIPPVQQQEEAAPIEPTPAPQTPEARPMQPAQLYPGQIPPAAPSTQTPATQLPMNRSTLDSNVGSPGPYMPQTMPAPYLVPYQQPMPPTQPYNPPTGYPRMEPGMQSGPEYRNPPTAIAGSAAIEAGSYFDQEGSNCPNGSLEASCSCAECSSCEAAFARPFYVSIFGGGDYVGDLTSDDNQTFLDFDTGGGVGIALGKVQGNNLRTDLEFTYRNSSFGSPSNHAVLGPIDGEVDSYSGMANAYWEFAAFPTTCWKPYFGGGIGFVFVDPTLNSNLLVDSDSSFAYQWMVGLNYKFSYRTDLFVEYREFYANDVAIEAGGSSSDIDFQTSNVFGGFRLKF